MSIIMSSDDYLNNQLKDPEFAKEYNDLEAEFSLASEIVTLRTQLNMTQRELAEKVGSSQPAIARLESGKYVNVSMRMIRKVAHALNAVPELHIRKVK